MSKAKVFEKTLPISSRGQAGLNRYEFAEAYQQSRVKAIIDKRLKNIKENPFRDKETQRERICELKLIKNKLLKK